MKIELNLSPNFSKKKREKKDVKYVIIHYTGMQSEIASINRLKNPRSKVSCHYLITKKGKIINMVRENKIAWHAGKSKWKNFKNLNSTSIGIELVNKGHKFGYHKFPNLQIRSLIILCKMLKKKYKIKNYNFLGHSDIAPMRKIDPGEKFPWKKLSKFEIGSWYKIRNKNLGFLDEKKNKYLFFRNIHKIGYRYFKLNKRLKSDRLIIRAFQLRYLPEKITGEIDLKLLKISQFLANSKKIT